MQSLFEFRNCWAVFKGSRIHQTQEEVPSQMVGVALWDLNIFPDIFRKYASAGVGDEFVNDALEFTRVSGPGVMPRHLHRLQRDDCAFASAAAEMGDKQR